MENISLQEQVIEKVLKERTYRLSFDLSSEYPKQGQFVSTGMQATRNNLKMIGYCVQIRKNIGAYGSDLYFVRHADGMLTTHENQNFYKLTEDQEQEVRKIFKILPEDEDFSLGYSMKGGSYLETSYIVEKADMKELPPKSPEPTMMNITIQDDKGNTEIIRV